VERLVSASCAIKPSAVMPAAPAACTIDSRRSGKRSTCDGGWDSGNGWGKESGN